jgi:GT2 family glycosyltransferase
LRDLLVIVPTLGRRPEWLRETLRSIVTQDHPADIRVVAPSSATIWRLCDDAKAEVTVHDEPGLSRAINVGLDTLEAHHRYVTWIGDDDLLAPNSLRRSVQALDKNPTRSMAYGRCRYIDAGGQTTLMFRPGLWAWWYSLYGRNLVPQPGSLLRTKVVVAAGGINETFRHAMDLDLFLRMWEIAPPVYVPHELGSFRQHATSITMGKVDDGESRRIRQEAAWRRHDRLYPFATIVARRGGDKLAWGAIRRFSRPII